jgi:hypothetical protein
MSPVTRKSLRTLVWFFISFLSGIIDFPLPAAEQNLDPEISFWNQNQNAGRHWV